jgi:glycosyltransferase involved in cell wall biosynthesis
MIEHSDVEGLGEALPDELAGRNITENYFPESVSAAHPYGVLYQGEFETPTDGTARAVRMHARALADTGLPVLLRSFSNVVVSEHGAIEPTFTVGIPAEVRAEVGHLLNADIAAFQPVIKHVVIRSSEHLRQLLMPKGAIPLEANDVEHQIAMRDGIYANTIVYSVWERDTIDPGIAASLARVKQCWVPCEQNRQLLVGAGVPTERVHVVPHPYEPSDIERLCNRRPARLHKGWKRFYSIGRWEPRKGFKELMAAFVMAFTPDDKVSLTIKYSGNGLWDEYPTPEAALCDAIIDAPQPCAWSIEALRARVTIIGGRVDASQITRLHFENNIYVSASHGEAHNFGAFDAKRAGNAMVYVPWGGVADFAQDSDIAVPFEMQLVPKSYRWEHGARWAGYATSALSEGLVRARLPDSFETPASYQNRFSLEAVGRQMRLLVDAAAPSRYPSKPPAAP